MSQNNEPEQTAQSSDTPIPIESAPRHKFLKNITHDELSTMTLRQKGFIISLRTLDQTIVGHSLNETVAEMFPPAHLFSDEIKEIPGVWIELRKYIDANGATLAQHSSRRVILTLATSLYEDAEDREAAIQIANAIVAEGRRPRNQSNDQSSLPPGRPPETPESSPRQLTADRVAHNVAMRLKDNQKKFNGDLGECWMDYVDEYEQVSLDYNLSADQKLQYLHNIVTRDAQRFYIDRVKSYATTFEQAVKMIDDEYNSAVRQTRVKNFLNSLRCHDLVGDKVDVAMALAKVYRLILKLSRQVPPSHRGDAHRIEFLRRAVIGYDWSKEPLSRVATNGLTFQQLYGELEAAVQLEKESRVATIRDRSSSVSRDQSDDAVAINYAGQGRYQNPRGKTVKRGSAPKARKDPLDIMGCFNCDAPDHMAKDCPNPKDYAKATARQLEYHKKKRTPNAIHTVLAHLCRQLDHVEECRSSSEDGIESDVELFRTAYHLEADEHREKQQGDSDNDSVEIFSVGLEMSCSGHDEFLGACIDSGAQKTVIGKQQATAYLSLTGNSDGMNTEGTDVKYKFGNASYAGLGSIVVRIPIGNTFFIKVKARIVDVDVPMLLGLDVLDKLKIVLNFSDYTMHSTTGNWTVPLSKKFGHAYVEWGDDIFYTEAELRKIHRHFYHPSTDKLFSVIKRADPESVAPGTHDLLEKVRDTCEVCQRNAAEPHRFRVSLPTGDCIFNRLVSMDIMFLDSVPVLHVVDKDTKFGAACILKDESSAGVWRAFLNIWVTNYIGFPDVVALDQGSQFRSHEFISLLMGAGIELHQSGVESHNALGSGERYHSYLRAVYRKVRDDARSLDKSDALKLAVKAVNDTAGPSGLVPTLLVFGVLPRLPVHPKDLPDQRERMRAMQSARDEMAKAMASSKVKVALSRNVPAASDKDVRILDSVLVFREKPLNKWLGPFTVQKVDEKAVYVDVNGKTTRFAIDKVKVYQHPDKGSHNNGDEAEEDGARIDRPIADMMDKLELPADASVTSESPERLRTENLELDEYGRYVERYWNLDRNNETEEVSIFTVKVLKPTDERAQHDDFTKAKEDEVRGLCKREIWAPVREADLEKDANILGGRFVLTLKNFETPDEKAKVRYVAQGYSDKDKPYMVHDVSTLRISSIRLILSVAAICGFKLFSHDVTQAYLQSKSNLTRQIYIRPKGQDREVLGLAEGELFELLRPLYGVCDAGDYWGITMNSHLINDLNMSQTDGDASLYFWKENGKLAGLTGMYVDDLLNAGNESFELHTQATLKEFDTKPRMCDTFDFFGLQVSTEADGSFVLSQRYHAQSLKPADVHESFECFRRDRALFSWLSNTRPDIACLANKSAQVTDMTHCKEKVRDLNRGVRKVTKSTYLGLRFGKLDFETIHLRVYADASYATNDDLSSQLGYLIMVCDENDKCHIVDFVSKKSRRVVRSIMGGEVYAFMDAFDAAYVLRKDLERLLDRSLEIMMFTDSRQLFDAVTSGRRTQERRLAIDIAAARQSYHRYEMSCIGFVRGADNPADSLSKVGGNDALDEIVRSGCDRTPVEQWILRDYKATSEQSTRDELPGGSVEK